MRLGRVAVAALALLAVATGAGVASANTPPLPAAGVDQTVTPDSTVYLDANGSVDPDGEIASVAWSIETPGGVTETPDCASCRQTQFYVDTLGRYTVTVSVTDDDGATRSDTLYVTVESGDGPLVALSGPASTSQNNAATFTANASTDEASLDTLAWVVDDEVMVNQPVSGSEANSSLTQSFGATENVTVTAVAYDTLGYRGSASQTVEVTAGSSGSMGSGCEDGDAWEGFCTGGSDARYNYDGETTLLDSNGEPGLQTYVGGDMVTIENPTSSQYIEEQTSEFNPDDTNLVITDGAGINEAVADTNTAESLEQETNDKLDNDGGSGSGNNPDVPFFGGGGGGGGGGGSGGSGGGGKGGGDGGKSPF